MRAIKLTVLAAVVVAAATLVAQNTEVVEVRVLFWTLSMSRIVLLTLVLTIGFFAGFLVGTLLRGGGGGRGTG